MAETGTGGASSSGSTRHIYLPTAAGPMPIVTIIDGQKYAVHSDHLNTPRLLGDDSGQPVWQWAYSAFGDEQPTSGRPEADVHRPPSSACRLRPSASGLPECVPLSASLNGLLGPLTARGWKAGLATSTQAPL